MSIQKGGKVSSKCTHVYDFQISAASKVSESKACTNVPATSGFCKVVHWKYNTYQHLYDAHPCWEESARRDLQGFHDKITIADKEDTRLGIPDDRQGVHVFDIDVHHRNPSYLPPVCDEQGDSPRRPRQGITNPLLSHYSLLVLPIQLPTPSHYPLPSIHDSSTNCLSLTY